MQGIEFIPCTSCEEDITDKCDHMYLCQNCDTKHRLCCDCYNDLIDSGEIKDVDVDMNEIRPEMLKKWT